MFATLGKERGPAALLFLLALLALLMLAVGAVVLVGHWPALSAKVFSFDDTQYLTKNRLVQNPGWHSAKRFLTEVLEPSTVNGYYQPLSMISLMLDVAIGGTPDNLRPFHLTSLCLHVTNTLLVIVLLYVLFRSIWPAVLVGLLFGVHPLTVEPIPWVGERKTLLASFFALCSIIVYVRYAARPDWRLFLGCTLLYILALMAKPTTTPLPLLLLLLDFWPLKRLSKNTLLEKVPLFLIMVIFAVITVVSQARTASAQMPGTRNLGQILLILSHNIIFYLYKIVWPANLSSHYPLPKSLAISDSMVLAGVVGTCVLLPLLLVSLRWTRVLITGWLFFFVAIFPTMGVIGFTNVIASDKFAYLPSLGLLIVLAYLLARLCEHVRGSTVWRVTIVAFLIAVAACEAFATRHYLEKWRDTETFYRYMLSLTPNAASLHDGLGDALKQKGETQQAIQHFRTAVKLNPKHYGFRNNLALILFRQGRVEEAITHFYYAVTLNPNYAAGHKNLAIALALQGKVDDAITHFRIALHLRPDDANLHYNLGVMLVRKELTEEAVNEFREALRIDPTHERARIAFETEAKKLETL
ncbi:MAG: tetratricopeptide repeat protein, partial [Planctomycetota bacterium]